MKCASVVDTNIPVVANGRASHVGEDCVETCIRALRRLQREGKILIDESGFIIDEYRSHLSPTGQPGLGDEFFKWLWNNQGNTKYCIRVDVTPLDDEGCNFSEFPDDPALESFDRSDRKFVAVALCHGNAQILNASDTDWWNFRGALEIHGIQICFLCPELMPERGID